MLPMNLSSIPYTSQYCEENVFNILANERFQNSFALFISNERRTVLLYHQNAGDSEGRVVWDYHVVCVSEKKKTIDRDSSLESPISISEYLELTFPKSIPSNLRAKFRLVSQAEMKLFSSDRSHMWNSETQSFHATPPSSAMCIGSIAAKRNQKHNLDSFISMVETNEFGTIFEGADDLKEYFVSMKA